MIERGTLRASRDPQQVGIPSRLIADLVARTYARHLATFCRGRLLDLGCGHVPLYGAYRDLVDEAVCVDWAGSLHPSEHLDLQCDLTAPLPFEDGRFETIILSDVLEHIPNPQQLWSEMARLLTPGGNVIMNVPFYYWLHEGPHDYYRYTEFALRYFARSSGFAVDLLEPIGGAPEILADILAKNLAHIPLAGTGCAAVIQALCSRLVTLPIGRAISRKTASVFPFGYFAVMTKVTLPVYTASPANVNA